VVTNSPDRGGPPKSVEMGFLEAILAYKHLGQFAALGREQMAAKLPRDWVSIGCTTQWLCDSLWGCMLVSSWFVMLMFPSLASTDAPSGALVGLVLIECSDFLMQDGP
ncbi:hypothetical protein Dimus_001857, partial [Dionaea muscipula]